MSEQKNAPPVFQPQKIDPIAIQPSNDAKATALAIAYCIVQQNDGLRLQIAQGVPKGEDGRVKPLEFATAFANYIGRMADSMVDGRSQVPSES